MIGQIVIGSFIELKRNPSFFFTSSYKSYTFTQKNKNESYTVFLIVCSRPPCELCALTIRINTPKNTAKKIWSEYCLIRKFPMEEIMIYYILFLMEYCCLYISYCPSYKPLCKVFVNWWRQIFVRICFKNIRIAPYRTSHWRFSLKKVFLKI